jgi:hypothetical protein
MTPQYPSVLQKRKAIPSITAAKRAKADLDRTDPAIPQKKNSVIKLGGPLPKVPDNAFINPTAQALFPQVKVHIRLFLPGLILDI